MKLILIRHGLTEENKKDILLSRSGGKLSDEGLMQVKKLAEKLKDEKIDFIYSSDLSRTKDTVLEILKYHKNSPVIYEPLLREMHKGIYDGKTSQELKNDFYKSGQKWYEFRPKDGENYQDLFKRAENFYKLLIRDNKSDDTILICSHESWLIAFVIYCQKLTFDKIDQKDYDFDNASITMVEIKNNECQVKQLNNTDHLSIE